MTRDRPLVTRVEITADVAGGDARAATGGNEDVRLVLADTLAEIDRLGGRVVHRGRAWLIADGAADLGHQVRQRFGRGRMVTEAALGETADCRIGARQRRWREIGERREL